MLRLLTPSTPFTVAWITFDRSEGGGTSVGPLGFWLIDVRSLHETLPMVNAAQTLRILYRI